MLAEDAGKWRVDVMTEPGDLSTWVYRRDRGSPPLAPRDRPDRHRSALPAATRSAAVQGAAAAGQERGRLPRRLRPTHRQRARMADRRAGHRLSGASLDPETGRRLRDADRYGSDLDTVVSSRPIQRLARRSPVTDGQVG